MWEACVFICWGMVVLTQIILFAYLRISRVKIETHTQFFFVIVGWHFKNDDSDQLFLSNLTDQQLL